MGLEEQAGLATVSLSVSQSMFVRASLCPILTHERACCGNEVGLKALPHDAIFLATRNAMPLWVDVKLANTGLRRILLMYSLNIQHCSLNKSLKSRIALQVARKIASCDTAFSSRSCISVHPKSSRTISEEVFTKKPHSYFL